MKRAFLIAICWVLCTLSQDAIAQCFSGWTRLVEIVVNNPNGVAISNQPVLVTVNTNALILAGKMRNDAGDVRFADTDCCTPLNYYVESATVNTASTKFWVNVPSLPANGSRKIILYYGNPGATSLSNADNVFLTLGNNNSGGTAYSADRTFNAKDYAWPFDVTTNVWRLQSQNSGSIAFKTTSSGNVIEGSGPVVGVNPGSNTFDLELPSTAGGNMGFYVGAGGNLNIGNGAAFLPPCGSTVAFLGNTNLGVGNSLSAQACGVFPNLKVWYRRRYATEPTVSQGPELSFAATISITAPSAATTYCSNGLLLTATSGFTTYQWYRDGSPISGATSGTYTAPPVAGTHNYHCVAILGSCINKTSNTLSLAIHPVPVLTSISPDVACAPSTTLGASFTLAFGSLSLYNWNFGDASSGTGATPTHTYPSHGTYATTLIVTSDQGCKDTLMENVVIYPKPVATVVAPASNCDPNAVPLTNNSTVNNAFGSTITTWAWTFGDATNSALQNPGSHTYPGPGNYNIQLITTTNFSCKDTADVPITVYPKPVINSLSVPDVCEPATSAIGQSTSLAPLPASTLSNYAWSFGDAITGTGPSPSHQYATPGSYAVTLIVTTSQNCRDTLTATHLYHPKPVISSITAPPVCEPLTTTLSNASSVSPVNSSVISSYLWNFGDGNTGTGASVNHAYAVSDTYMVQLVTVTNQGCRDTLTTEMDVYPKPVITSVSSPPVCWNNAVNFNHASQVAGLFGASIASYDWSFGDNQSGTGPSQSHHYAAAGRYNAALLVTTNHGCADTIGTAVSVYPKPVIQSITSTDVCDPAINDFQNVSVVDTLFASSVTQWDWDFGDGATGTGSSTPHDYLNPGGYLSTLVVHTGHGCSDTLTDSVFLYPKPIAAFVSTDRCEPEAYLPLDASSVSNAAGAVLSNWDWDFGDSYTSTLQNPSHQYALPGSFAVVLQVTTNHGCMDTVVQVMNYNHKPQAAFSWPTNCWPQAATFTDGSTISGSFLDQWGWDFGDGQSDTVQNPAHAFAVADTYTVTLVVTSFEGCKDTLALPVVSNPKPLASFEVAMRCMPAALPFHNLSTIGAGALVQTDWDFGDGSTDTLFSPSHAYAAAGSYTVTLVEESDSGCIDTVVTTLVVNPAPAAGFEVNNVCIPLPAVFADSSQGNLVGWSWDFGDGGMDTVQHPTHAYTAAGTYIVQLVVITDSACTDTSVIALPVHPEAQLTLGPDIFHCLYDTLVLRPMPWQPTHLWNDSTTLDTLRIWQPGTYAVEIQDTNLCFARDTIVVTAAPTIALTITPGPDVNLCQGASMTLDASHPDGQSWLWNNGSTDNALPVDSAGLYTAIVFNQYACRDTDSVMVHLIPGPQPGLGPDTAFCFEDSVTLYPGPGFSSWAWSTGSTDSTLVVTRSGLYEVTVTDPNGCQGTDFVNINVLPLPFVDLGPDLEICHGESVLLSAGQGHEFYNWSNGATGMEVVLDASISIFVEAIDLTGCSDISNVLTLTVHPLPAVPDLLKDGPLLSTTSQSAAYQWYLDGDPIPGADAATFIPSLDGDYLVEVTDSNGCKSRSMPMNVIAEVVTESVPQAITPNGDGANDALVIHGIEFFPQCELTIYNRWGHELNRFLGYSNDWDGHYDGQPLPAGTYYYILKLNAEAQLIKGYVQIEY